MSDQNPQTPPARPAEPEGDRYIVLRPILHGGALPSKAEPGKTLAPVTRLEVGKGVVLTRAQAAQLLADGAIKPEIVLSGPAEVTDLTKSEPKEKK